MTQNGIPQQRLLTMQIIAGALMMGVVMFAAVAVFMTLGKEPENRIMAYFGVGIALLAIVMQGNLPAIIASGGIRQLREKLQGESSDEPIEQLVNIYQMRMIVCLAWLELASFFNLMMYLISIQWWSLAVVGVLLLAMAMSFPTRFKVENWIEAKQYELDLGQ